MKDPKTKTKVRHSKSKAAWYVIATSLGSKYKIAELPYVANSEAMKQEAHDHAQFIAACFNNSSRIMAELTPPF